MVLIEDITDQRRAEKEAAAAAAALASPPPPPPPSSGLDGEDIEAKAKGKDEGGDEEDDLLPSDERLLDAQEIERVASLVARPTAKLHLTSLVAKLKREAEALQRMEKSRHLQSSPSPPSKPQSGKKAAAPSPRTDENADPKAAAPPPASASTAASGAVPASLSSPPPRALPASGAASAPAAPGSAAPGHYVPVDRFGFDAGGYNAPYVTLYVDLPGVGGLDRSRDVSCRFDARTVDLVVRNLGGKSYRLFRDNLDKDIDPAKSKIVVKADRVVVKLAKKKSEYGSYDYWTSLTSKKKPKPSSGAGGGGEKEDPGASIMQMMKDMYDDGDDNIRKVIGETMLKQRTGELGKDPMAGMGGMGGGLGGMGGGLGGDDDDDDF
jgi:calcyclin binding protein